MRVAIVGSRNATEDVVRLILQHLPAKTTEIVSGGAEGIDKLAKQVAQTLDLPITVFPPNYSVYGRIAPLKRNEQIIAYADEVLAFWDGESRGTKHVIACCIREGRPIRVIPLTGGVVDGGTSGG